MSRTPHGTWTETDDAVNSSLDCPVESTRHASEVRIGLLSIQIDLVSVKRLSQVKQTLLSHIVKLQLLSFKTHTSTCRNTWAGIKQQSKYM